MAPDPDAGNPCGMHMIRSFEPDCQKMFHQLKLRLHGIIDIGIPKDLVAIWKSIQKAMEDLLDQHITRQKRVTDNPSVTLLSGIDNLAKGISISTPNTNRMPTHSHPSISAPTDVAARWNSVRDTMGDLVEGKIAAYRVWQNDLITAERLGIKLLLGIGKLAEAISQSEERKRSGDLLKDFDSEPINTPQGVVLGSASHDKGFDLLEKNFQRLDKGFERLDKGMERLDKGFERLDKGMEKLDKGMELFDKGFERLDNGMGKLDKGYERLDEGFERLDKGMGWLNEGYERLDKGMERLDKGMERLDKGFERLDKGMERLDKGVERLDKGVERLDKRRKLNADEGFVYV